MPEKFGKVESTAYQMPIVLRILERRDRIDLWKHLGLFIGGFVLTYLSAILMEWLLKVFKIDVRDVPSRGIVMLVMIVVGLISYMIIRQVPRDASMWSEISASTGWIAAFPVASLTLIATMVVVTGGGWLLTDGGFRLWARMRIGVPDPSSLVATVLKLIAEPGGVPFDELARSAGSPRALGRIVNYLRLHNWIEISAGTVRLAAGEASLFRWEGLKPAFGDRVMIPIDDLDR